MENPTKSVQYRFYWMLGIMKFKKTMRDINSLKRSGMCCLSRQNGAKGLKNMSVGGIENEDGAVFN